MNRLHRDDRGAALVLALAFITVVSIGTTALMTLTDTGQRTTVAVREQGFEVYAADGSVDQAITAVRTNPGLGRHLGPCPDVDTTLNGVPTTVRCAGAPGSGGVTGGAATSDNTPPNAVLTLAPQGGERGLVQESNNELRITGPVVSNNSVDVEVASASLVVTGQLSARDSCSPNATSSPAAACDLAGAPIPSSVDPGYDMHPDAPASAPPAAAPPIQGCGSGKVVVLSPGTYSSVADLNSAFAACSGSVFWFKPGFYYFDFQDSTMPWEITGSSTQVVGGVRARWTPPAPSAGDPRPVVPFPVDAVDAVPPLPDVPAVPGGCVTSTESPTTPGVQFAFGGTSRLLVRDARVELCAAGSATEQQIAFYGLPPAQDTSAPAPPAPTPVTVTYTSPGPATTSGTPLFTDPDAARTAGSGSASVTGDQSGSGSVSTLRLPSFTGSPIPSGATISSVALRVVHRPVNGNVTRLAARVQRAGATVASVGDTNAAGCGSSTTTALCLRPTASAYEQVLPLTGTFTPSSVSALDVELDAGTKTGNSDAGQELVDYLALEITYTPAASAVVAPYRRLSGCTAISLEAGGCPLLQTTGAPTALSLHGTLYAPTGAVRIELTNVGSQVLERGLIARTARVKVTGSSTFSGSPIQLPALSGSSANREVVFTAEQSGRDVLRARVRFDDLRLLGPDKRADVTSWHVLR